MRIVSVGHAVFAATMIGGGIAVLIMGDFTGIWQPDSTAVPARHLLADLCALVSIAAGIGLLWQRTAAPAARGLLGFLLLWMLLFRAPDIIQAPLVEGSYEDPGETTVIVAGAWVLYAWLAAGWDRRRLGFATGDAGLRIARTLFGLALIPLGLAHFFYLQLTAPLVPKWLPWHVGWAYFTGSAYIAAGIAVLIGVAARLAITLTALQMGLITLLVWVPIVAAGSKDAFQWSETFASWSLTAAAWVVADSCRGMVWVGRNKR